MGGDDHRTNRPAVTGIGRLVTPAGNAPRYGAEMKEMREIREPR